MIARVLSCPGLITDILGMLVAFVKKPRQNAGSGSLSLPGKIPNTQADSSGGREFRQLTPAAR